MQNIKGANTKPEMVLRKALWHKGYRYRKNWKDLPGKPDIVLTKYRICVFIDSEFFHGKGFYGDYDSRKYNSLEEQLIHSSHPEFWLKKIKGNMHHDELVNAELADNGWKVVRFWSKDVMQKTDDCVARIEQVILSVNGEKASLDNL